MSCFLNKAICVISLEISNLLSKLVWKHNQYYRTIYIRSESQECTIYNFGKPVLYHQPLNNVHMKIMASSIIAGLPDLSFPLKYFLWGLQKAKVHFEQPDNINEVKPQDQIREETIAINNQITARAINKCIFTDQGCAK